MSELPPDITADPAALIAPQPVDYPIFQRRLAEFFLGKGYVTHQDRPVFGPVEQDFFDAWGPDIHRAAATMAGHLTPWQPLVLYTRGRYAPILGHFIVVVALKSTDLPILPKVLSQAARDIPFSLRGGGVLDVFVYLHNAGDDLRGQVARAIRRRVRFKGLVPQVIRPYAFLEKSQSFHWTHLPHLPRKELELQVGLGWRGYFVRIEDQALWHQDASDGGSDQQPEETGVGHRLLVVKVPLFCHVETVALLARATEGPFALHYNDHASGQVYTAAQIEALLARHRQLIGMEGFGELDIRSEASRTRILSSTLHDISVLWPGPAHEEALTKLGLSVTDLLYQREGYVKEQDKFWPGVNVYREPFRHLPSFKAFTAELGVDYPLPPGYGQGRRSFFLPS